MEQSGTLPAEMRAIVDDLVTEMDGRAWPFRRKLVARVQEVEQIALSLRQQAESDPNQDAGSSDVQVLGKALAAALWRLGAEEAVCRDSAFVLALSADVYHRQAARDWIAANPRAWQSLQPTYH